MAVLRIPHKGLKDCPVAAWDTEGVSLDFSYDFGGVGGLEYLDPAPGSGPTRDPNVRHRPSDL